MTVDELIEKLLKVSDRTQKVYYFDVDSKFGKLDLHNFNTVRESKYDYEDLVLFLQED